MKYSHNLFRREDFSESDVQMITSGNLNGIKTPEPPQGGAGGGAAATPGAAAAVVVDDKGAAGAGAASVAKVEDGKVAGAGDDKGAAGAGDAAQETPEQKAARENQELAYEQKFYGKIGGGKFKTADEINAEINRIATLQTELETAKAQPKFVSPRAELMHKMANKFEAEGMSTDGMRRYIEIVTLPLDKLPDHELRFEQMRFDPQYKNLSLEDLRQVHAYNELQKYGDPTVDNGQTPVQKILAKNDAQLAKDALAKHQLEFQSAKSAVPSPEDQVAEKQQYLTDARTQLANFDGIDITLTAIGDDQKKIESPMKFTLDAAKNQKQAILDAVADPQSWWANMLKAEGVLKDGDPQRNLTAMGKIMAKFMFHQEQVNAAYSQGRTEMHAHLMKQRRNAQETKEGAQGAAGASGGTKKTGEEEMVAGAMTTLGMS